LVRYIEENEVKSSATIQEPPPSAFLALVVNERISHSFPLRGEMQLGREKDNAIVVADQKVSRHHAILTAIDETFIIQDQGSANGTYVNGVQIAQPTRLKDNDQIKLGDTTFLFVIGPTEPSTFEQPPPAAVISAPPQPIIGNRIPPTTDSNMPIWLTIGCMAAAIVVLLLILALMFGLFIGRGQVVGLAMWWLITMM
jgi:hypothetical protein